MQPTIRLFDADVNLRAFTARVLSCETAKDGFDVVLDRTAFFPEGGGQMGDRGTLGGAAVRDTHEKDGVILHRADRALPVGAEVSGEIDALHRLDMMQQHTGEHILSGLICRTFHCDNVGFHIGTDAVTIDFNTVLTPEDVARVERAANEAVWRDQPVITQIPDPQTLAAMTYRSKKELTGEVRIVTIEGVDCCACCGTHCPTTGRVGQIRVLSCIHYKGGVRLTIVCGMRALAAADATLAENRAVSQALSAKQGELAQAVERLLRDRDEQKLRADRLADRAFALAAASEQGAVRVVAAEGLAPAQLRKAAGRLAEGAKLALVLLPREDGWSFALSGSMDVRPAAQALCAAFGGKGGGPADMAQGVLAGGEPEALRAVLVRCAGESAP